jgi:hypothetical protein
MSLRVRKLFFEIALRILPLAFLWSGFEIYVLQVSLEGNSDIMDVDALRNFQSAIRSKQACWIVACGVVFLCFLGLIIFRKRIRFTDPH